MKYLKRSITLTVFFIMIAFISQAQEIKKSTVTEYIGGNYYYLHTVEKGQTVSAIALAYDVPQEEIFAVNPDVKKTLKAGSVIKVPVKKQSGKDPIVHKVVQGETLTGIAQHYKVKIEDILKINPGLSPNNLKIGQEIKIPRIGENKDETVARETLGVHVVQSGETLFGIARKYNVTVDDLKKVNPGLNETIQIGQQIRYPVRGQEVTTPDKPKDSITFICGETGMMANYNIGLMVPLYLERATYIDTSDKDNPLRNFSSFQLIGFYEGFMMAVDTLKSMGLSLNLYIDDVTEDSAKLQNVLRKEGYDSLQLLVGPFFSSVFETVSDWTEERKIKTVNPFTYLSDFVIDKPYVIKSVASCDSQAFQAVAYARKTWPGCNLILAETGAPADTAFVNAYRKALLGADSSAQDCFFVNYQADGCSGISKYMSPDKVNVVFSFVHGEVAVSNYIRNMNELTYKFPIVAFGSRDWDNYQSLEVEYLLNIHLHQVAYSFVDYTRNDVKEFIIEYRKRYKTEPDNYAFSGYDIGFYFLNALRLYGKDFQNCLDDYKVELLSTPYKFVKLPNGGYENSAMCIYRYEDFQAFDAIKQPQTEIKVTKKRN